MTMWLAIVAMALVTYATRVTMLFALRGEIATWLRRWLSFVPVAVFTALIVPPLLLQTRAGTSTLVFGPQLAAGLIGALAAWFTRNVLATIGAGLITFWLLRWLGL